MKPLLRYSSWPSRQNPLTWFSREQLTNVEHNPGPIGGSGGRGGRGRRPVQRGNANRRIPSQTPADNDNIGMMTAAYSGHLAARPWVTPDKSMAALAESLKISILSPAFRSLSVIVAHVRDNPDDLHFTVNGTTLTPHTVTAEPFDEQLEAAEVEPLVPHTPAPRYPIIQTGRIRSTFALPAQAAASSSTPPPTILAPSSDPTSGKRSRSTAAAPMQPNLKLPRLAAVSGPLPAPRSPLARHPADVPDEPVPSESSSTIATAIRDIVLDAAIPRANIRDQRGLSPHDAMLEQIRNLSPDDIAKHKAEMNILMEQAMAAARGQSPRSRR